MNRIRSACAIAGLLALQAMAACDGKPDPNPQPAPDPGSPEPTERPEPQAHSSPPPYYTV
ncbi:MAG: hypothetical protein DIU56_009005 [Pseudomonadota bacterium]|jgi:hypothetical protein